MMKMGEGKRDMWMYECTGEGEGEEKMEKVREGKRGNDMDGET